MPKKFSASSILFTLTPIVLVAVVGFAIWNSNKPSAYDDFAQCLTEKGAVMYGAWWCPHCENQKKEFGTAFEHVNYFECSPGGSRAMSAECRAAGITSFPTWRFEDDGEDLKGEQPLSVLAERTGCELPSDV